MTTQDIAAIAGKLSDTERADFTSNWDHFCQADYGEMRTDDPDYPARLEAGGYVHLDAVDDDDLETSFAWELGIEPGGSVYRLTPLGIAVRSYLANHIDGKDRV